MTIDEENLKRILAGEPLLVPWRCKIGWHTWSKWKPVKVFGVNPYMPMRYKRRKCFYCNKTKSEYHGRNCEKDYKEGIL
jgi:hypothetical protein